MLWVAGILGLISPWKLAGAPERRIVSWPLALMAALLVPGDPPPASSSAERFLGAISDDVWVVPAVAGLAFGETIVLKSGGTEILEWYSRRLSRAAPQLLRDIARIFELFEL